MADIKDIANAMFKNKKEWYSLSDEDKNKYFFIFNRYFSKKYPNLSFLLNLKSGDKALGMDLWYNFMLNKPYPNWFWDKNKKTNNENSNIINKEDLNLLLNHLKIKESDLNYLIKYHFDIIKEELNHLKSRIKTNK